MILKLGGRIRLSSVIIRNKPICAFKNCIVLVSGYKYVFGVKGVNFQPNLNKSKSIITSSGKRNKPENLRNVLFLYKETLAGIDSFAQSYCFQISQV